MIPADSACLENTIIADPGDAGAIPVTQSGVCALTSAGVETRSLPIPTYVGQWLMIITDTYVGAITITATQQINQATNTIMTVGAVEDMAFLISGTVGGALRWRLIANDGMALS